MFRAFIADRRGNFAVIMGVILLPVIAVMGAAIDYSRMHAAETRLQGVADATLVAAIQDAHDPSSLLYLARQYAQGNANGMEIEAEIDLEPGKVGLTLSTDLDLPFLAAAGMPEVTLEAHSRIATAKDFSGGSAINAARVEALRRHLRREIATQVPPRFHDEMYRWVDERMDLLKKAEPGDLVFTR